MSVQLSNATSAYMAQKGIQQNTVGNVNLNPVTVPNQNTSLNNTITPTATVDNVPQNTVVAEEEAPKGNKKKVIGVLAALAAAGAITWAILKGKGKQAAEIAKDAGENIAEEVKENGAKIVEEGKEVAEHASEKVGDMIKEAGNMVEDAVKKGKEIVEKTAEEITKKA